jgi:hypothetical protein
MGSEGDHRYFDTYQRPHGPGPTLQVVKVSEDYGADGTGKSLENASPFDFVDLAGEFGGTQGRVVDSSQDQGRLTIELGRVRLPRERLASLDIGDVVSMDQDAQQPVSVLVNGVVAAYGHLVTVEGRIAVRIQERVDNPSAFLVRRAA